MASMINCPNCKNEVSVLAISCPACGFPIILYTSMESKGSSSNGDPLELIAINPDTPQVILRALYKNGSPPVRSALTRNPNAPDSLIYQIATDWNADVRTVLASSPFLTTEVMEKLSNDMCRNVVAALSQNLVIPEYMRRELEQQLEEYDSADNNDDDDRDCHNTYNDDMCEELPPEVIRDEFGGCYYRYGDMCLPYHADGTIEYEGKSYDVMDGSTFGGETMFFDEDNGWLTELP